MKQIDSIDSVTHLNFPDSATAERRNNIGAFCLAIFGIVGLVTLFSPNLQFGPFSATEKADSTKFWLTPTSLNSEQTAFHTSTDVNSSNKAGQSTLVATSNLAIATVNY
ncbi:MAG: hypothetical protein AAF960_25110 [Bacteroidota bacterium]